MIGKLHHIILEHLIGAYFLLPSYPSQISKTICNLFGWSLEYWAAADKHRQSQPYLIEIAVPQPASSAIHTVPCYIIHTHCVPMAFISLFKFKSSSELWPHSELYELWLQYYSTELFPSFSARLAVGSKPLIADQPGLAGSAGTQLDIE